jgi:3-phenylpropionate/trans-cinnamate dioxygenase ferredoxin subunit
MSETRKPARERVRHVVCPAAALPPGQRRIVEVAGRSIGVFNVDGDFLALANVCPHQRAPLCKGTLALTADADSADQWQWREDSPVIRCPWHGWEFDLRTGRSVYNPHRMGVLTYPVALEDGCPVDRSTDEPDPTVDTYAVQLEDQLVVLYV